MIVGLEVMSADRPEGLTLVPVIDEATTHLGVAPEVVCADAGYGSGENRAECESRDIRLVSPPKQIQTSTEGEYFTVADFQYDATRDVFVCPSGSELHSVGGVLGRPKLRRYTATRAACGRCLLRARCTKSNRRQLKVSMYHEALTRLRADHKTESFQALYRRRAPVIEGIFAEAKQWHGLRRAWRRGLSKMRIQCLLIASCTLHSGFTELINELLKASETILRLITRFDNQPNHQFTEYERSFA